MSALSLSKVAALFKSIREFLALQQRQTVLPIENAMLGLAVSYLTDHAQKLNTLENLRDLSLRMQLSQESAIIEQFGLSIVTDHAFIVAFRNAGKQIGFDVDLMKTVGRDNFTCYKIDNCVEGLAAFLIAYGQSSNCELVRDLGMHIQLFWNSHMAF